MAEVVPPALRHDAARLLLVAGGVLALTACDGYESPCEVTSERLVVDEPAPPQSWSSLVSFEDRGDVAGVAWLTHLLDPDLPPPGIRPWLVQVALIDREGSMTDRYAFAAFEDRLDGPEDNLGLCWTSLGVVLHWTQDLTVSAVGDPPSVRTALRTRRIFPDGTAGPVSSPVNMSCVDCTVRVTSACHADTATILFASWREGEDGPGPPRALAWNLASDSVTSGPLDWLPASSRWPAPALRIDGDVLMLVTADQAWPVDAVGSSLGGPIPLPVPTNRQWHWDDERYESTVVWSAAGTGDRDDVLLLRHDGFGEPLSDAVRLGASSQVAALARDGGHIGVIFRDGGQDALAWAGSDGSRIGGDVRLGPAYRPSTSGTGYGELLRPLGSGRFDHLAGEPGRVRRREILCAP